MFEIILLTDICQLVRHITSRLLYQYTILPLLNCIMISNSQKVLTMTELLTIVRGLALGSTNKRKDR